VIDSQSRESLIPLPASDRDWSSPFHLTAKCAPEFITAISALLQIPTGVPATQAAREDLPVWRSCWSAAALTCEYLVWNCSSVFGPFWKAWQQGAYHSGYHSTDVQCNHRSERNFMVYPIQILY